MMKRYCTYSDSGIEWIKEFPSGWELVRFKRLAKIKNGKDQKEVSIDEGGYPILGTGGEFGRASQFIHDKPSVLLGRKGTINKPQFIEKPFWTVDTLFYTEINDDVNPKYLFYLSQQIPFDLLQESSAVPSMTQEKLNSVFVIKPSLAEQSQIATYLDHQTAIIDQLVQQKEKLIQLLKEQRQSIINELVAKGIDPNVKMKDSGIDWVNEIPECWEVAHLKRFVLDNRQGFYSSKEYDSVGYRLARITDIKENNILDLADSPYYNLPESEIGDFILKDGDFVFQRTGAHKKIGVYKGTEPAIYGSFLIRFRFNKTKINPKFLLMYFDSYVYQNQLNSSIHGGVNPNIHAENIKECLVIVPSKEEQEAIVKIYIQESEKVILLVEKLNLQLEKLKEYRQSIISEAVTGKIDVRDWQLSKSILA